MRKPIVLIISLLFTIASMTSYAHAHDLAWFYTSHWFQSHEHVGWTVGWKFFEYFPTGKKRERVKESFGKWNDLAGSLEFNFNGETGLAYSFHCDGPQSYNGIFSHELESGTLAETNICHHFDEEANVAHQFFIRFDDRDGTEANWEDDYDESEVGNNEYDFKSVAVHEVGHATDWGSKNDTGHYEAGGDYCTLPGLHTMCPIPYLGATTWRELKEHDKHTYNNQY